MSPGDTPQGEEYFEQVNTPEVPDINTADY